MMYEEGRQFALSQLQLEKTALFPKGQPARILHSLFPLSVFDVARPALQKLPTERINTALRGLAERLEQRQARQTAQQIRQAMGTATPGPVSGSVVLRTAQGPQTISARALEDLTGAFPLQGAPRRPTPSVMAKAKTAAAATLPSQDEIYQQVLATLPETLRQRVQHASGGLPDARGFSDVDISYHTDKPHDLLETLPQGTAAERRDDTHTIYSLPGYPRPVNLYATADPVRAQRALKHRTTELALAEQYPQLAELARKAKAGGLGTEKAWAKVLGAQGDPYEAMLDKDQMLTLAKALQSSKVAQHKLSRRTEFRGLKISVETDKGEKRHWYDPHNEEKGTTTMKYPYGYIRRTEGIDGDHVDVYIGPNEDAKNVYVVHQQKAPNFDRYDEDKCMLGFNSADEAKKAYLDHYNDKRFFGSMTVMPFEQFKKKVLSTFKRPQKIAGTNLKFMLQLEKDFGKDFARRLFEETTRAAKGQTVSRPMTATIRGGRVIKRPIAQPPPLPMQMRMTP